MALIEALRAGGEVPKETIDGIKVTHHLEENLFCVEYANHFDQERLICSKNDWKEPTAAQDCSRCEGVRIMFHDQRWIWELSKPAKCINLDEGIKDPKT
ncbi:MAG: hypothetical protein ABSB83_03480 [Methanomassiliicoccales archaeon]|jgi:hypothetical protein